MISGEDLANVGPVALLNDLAVMAVLGIEDEEVTSLLAAARAFG